MSNWYFDGEVTMGDMPPAKRGDMYTDVTTNSMYTFDGYRWVTIGSAQHENPWPEGMREPDKSQDDHIGGLEHIWFQKFYSHAWCLASDGHWTSFSGANGWINDVAPTRESHPHLFVAEEPKAMQELYDRYPPICDSHCIVCDERYPSNCVHACLASTGFSIGGTVPKTMKEAYDRAKPLFVRGLNGSIQDLQGNTVFGVLYEPVIVEQVPPPVDEGIYYAGAVSCTAPGWRLYREEPEQTAVTSEQVKTLCHYCGQPAYHGFFTTECERCGVNGENFVHVPLEARFVFREAQRAGEKGVHVYDPVTGIPVVAATKEAGVAALLKRVRER